MVQVNDSSSWELFGAPAQEIGISDLNLPFQLRLHHRFDANARHSANVVSMEEIPSPCRPSRMAQQSSACFAREKVALAAGPVQLRSSPHTPSRAMMRRGRRSA